MVLNLQVKALFDGTTFADENISCLIIFITFFQCDASLADIPLKSVIIQHTVQDYVFLLETLLESAFFILLRKRTRIFEADVMSFEAYQISIFSTIN